MFRRVTHLGKLVVLAKRALLHYPFGSRAATLILALAARGIANIIGYCEQNILSTPFGILLIARSGCSAVLVQQQNNCRPLIMFGCSTNGL